MYVFFAIALNPCTIRIQIFLKFENLLENNINIIRLKYLLIKNIDDKIIKYHNDDHIRIKYT
jgi:hypothetical protein